MDEKAIQAILAALEKDNRVKLLRQRKTIELERSHGETEAYKAAKRTRRLRLPL